MLQAQGVKDFPPGRVESSTSSTDIQLVMRVVLAGPVLGSARLHRLNMLQPQLRDAQSIISLNNLLGRFESGFSYLCFSKINAISGDHVPSKLPTFHSRAGKMATCEHYSKTVAASSCYHTAKGYCNKFCYQTLWIFVVL